MQKIRPLLGLLLVIACSPNNTILNKEEQKMSQANEEPQAETTSQNEPLNTRSKADILNYFNELIANKQILIGQHCGEGADTTRSHYNDYVGAFKDITGREVGILM